MANAICVVPVLISVDNLSLESKKSRLSAHCDTSDHEFMLSKMRALKAMHKLESFPGDVASVNDRIIGMAFVKIVGSYTGVLTHMSRERRAMLHCTAPHESQHTDKYFLDVVAACAFREPVTFIRNRNVNYKSFAEVLDIQCAQTCMTQQTCGDELCSAFFQRGKATIPNCAQNASCSTAVCLPWPFSILTAYEAFVHLVWSTTVRWPRCDIGSTVKEWQRTQLVVRGDDDKVAALPEDTAIADPVLCRELSDFLKSRLPDLENSAVDQEETRAFVNSKIVWLECLADSLMPDAVYNKQVKHLKQRGGYLFTNGIRGGYDSSFLCSVLVFHF